MNAGVPLGIACFDYRTRQVRLVDYLTLSGDVEADLARIRDAYQDCRGLHEDCASPVGFASAEQCAQPDEHTRQA